MFDNINDKSFVDVPSSSPKVKFPLQKIGIGNRPHYIRVIDPFGSEPRDLWVQLKVFFSLPADQRGVHMSRIEEAMHFIQQSTPDTLERYAAQLSKKLIELQKISACEVEFSADYEKTVDKNRSGKISSELIKLHGKINCDGNMKAPALGVTVPFINACPCTQRWAMREYYNSLKAAGREERDIAALFESAPRQAHTNRGAATLWVESDLLSYQDIYSVLDDSVPILRELLKGMDEHDLIKEAHRQGMFCEDNIRQILTSCAKQLSTKLKPETGVRVAVEVDESVHHHNLTSEVIETIAGLSSLK